MLDVLAGGGWRGAGLAEGKNKEDIYGKSRKNSWQESAFSMERVTAKFDLRRVSSSPIFVSFE